MNRDKSFNPQVETQSSSHDILLSSSLPFVTIIRVIVVYRFLDVVQRGGGFDQLVVYLDLWENLSFSPKLELWSMAKNKEHFAHLS